MPDSKNEGLQFETPVQMRKRVQKLTEYEVFRKQIVQVLTKVLEKHPVQRMPGWEEAEGTQ